MKNRRQFRSTERRGFWPLWLKVCSLEGIENTRENRHVLYCQALGYEKNQNEFGHAEWDKVFETLRQRARGLNPEGPERVAHAGPEGELKRLRHTLEEKAGRLEQLRREAAAAEGVSEIARLAPEAYIAHLARAKFGIHSNWRNLPAPKLDQLRITLIERVRAKERKAKREAAQGKINFSQPAAKDPATEIKGNFGQIIVDDCQVNDAYYEV